MDDRKVIRRQRLVTTIAAGAAHAMISSGVRYSAQSAAAISFDYAEAFVTEAERRAKALGIELDLL